MVFKNALPYLSADVKKLIYFYGNGGQTYISAKETGLARAWNFRREGDPVPLLPGNQIKSADSAKYDIIILPEEKVDGVGPFKKHYFKPNYDEVYGYNPDVANPEESSYITIPQESRVHPATTKPGDDDYNGSLQRLAPDQKGPYRVVGGDEGIILALPGP